MADEELDGGTGAVTNAQMRADDVARRLAGDHSPNCRCETCARAATGGGDYRTLKSADDKIEQAQFATAEEVRARIGRNDPVADACCKTDVHAAVDAAALTAPSPAQADMEAAHREASWDETVRRLKMQTPRPHTLVEDALTTMRRASAEIERLRETLAKVQGERDSYKAEVASAAHERMELARMLGLLEERLKWYEPEEPRNHAGADKPEIDRLHDDAIR